MAQKLRKLIIIGIIIVGIVLITLFLLGQRSSGKAMVVSVSSDGHYALSSNEDKTVTLWNLKRHNYRVVGTNANIYSAYFIPHSHKFIWQDLNDIVHVQNVEGTQLKHFHNFPTYGQVMTSDLKHYFAMDDDWNLYKGIGNKQKTLKTGYLSFWGEGKLDNLVLSDNEHYLLTTGAPGAKLDKRKLNQPKGHYNLDGVVLWQVKTGQPIQKFPGLSSLVNGTLAPDSKHIIAGQVGGKGLVWQKDSSKPERRINYLKGALKHDNNGDPYRDKHGFPKMPKDFTDSDGDSIMASIFSLKFITEHTYLRLNTNIPYAVIYRLNDSKPIKYLKLGRSPYPSVNDYQRNASIDTSWRAHILVTGQQKQGGIIEYKYNPNKQTLKKVWAPQPKKWQVWWREWI